MIWSGSTQRSPISKKAFVLWASDDFYHFTFVSNTTVSTCVDRVIEMHFPEFSLYSGSENVAILSDEATKIDIMHSLMFLHRKRLHCILDVSQISLRLTLLFLYDPILSRFLSYIVSQIILFWKSLSSQMGRRKPPNLLWPWRHYSSHS